MTWNEFTAMVEQKLSEAGAYGNVNIAWIDAGTRPEPRNLDIAVDQDGDLRIEWHS